MGGWQKVGGYGVPIRRAPCWMRRAVACLSLAIVGAATALAGSASHRDPHFRRITLSDGLPAAGVQEMLQDRQGFIWMATQEGLARYDGYEFEVYRHDAADPTSLAHDFVLTILEDRSGRLWVGSDGGGISRFNPADGSFSHYRHDPEDVASLSSDRVTALIEDRNGDLWAGTDGDGLNRMERGSGRFISYRHTSANPRSLGSNRIFDLAEDKLGMIWVATDGGGLSVLDPRTGQVTRFLHDPTDPTSLSNNRLRAVYEDGRGVLWVGTRDAGLNRLDRAAGRFTRFAPEPGNPRSLSSSRVSSIFEDAAGTLWVGTDGGLCELRPEGVEFACYRHNPVDRYSLSHNRVVDIFQDRGGALWVSTYSGVNSWNPATSAFLHEFHDSTDPTALSESYVTSFAEDGEGGIWVGTNGGGLNLFDREKRLFRRWRHDPTDPSSLSEDQVFSLLVDRRGSLWVGTRAGGLNRFDPATGTFRRYRHDPKDEASLSADGVTAIVEDRQGRLWLGTYGGGLNRLDASTGRFVRYRHDPSDPATVSSERVMSLWEDRAGILWIATEDAGINRYDSATDSFTTYRHDPGDAASLSSDGAWFVTGDAQDDLWIATRDAGLNRWRAADRAAGQVRFEHYSTSSHLLSNVILGMTTDASGDLWASTSRGLSHLARADGEFTHYDASSGLRDNEFVFASAFRASDGQLFFGGVNGFSYFWPEALARNEYRPPVRLTAFEKFNERVDFGRPVHEVETIELVHRDSVIAFRFAALDFTAPEKNRYRYRLEGFDRDWVDAGGARQATYTNLKSGSYVFRVQAANNDGLWNTDGLAVELTMAPPPWHTWWAYGLYLLTLGAVIARVILSFRRRRAQAVHLAEINVSLTREIAERKAKEAALEEEKRKARTYLDVAEVIMLALDAAGKVILINQKGCRILGVEEAEIVGQAWLERFVPESHRAEVEKRLADVGRYQYYEYPVLTTSGEERTIAWHSTSLSAASEDPAIVLCSGSDVTRERALEQEVRHRQKMDALGTLAGGVAHDFNNILTAIFGYSTLALGQLPPTSEQAGYLEQVIKACERAKDLVSRILTFSRRGEQDKRSIDVREPVLEACELLRSSLPATIEVRTTVDRNCQPVMADPTQIHQVVMNLGTNAAHAMAAGGTLSVGIDMVERAETSDKLSEGRSKEQVRLTVADTGHGMEAEIVDKVFDPFFTTKKVGSGTGLGLSVVHGIVTSHGGEISVASTPGQGTIFTILLPCTQLKVARRDADATPVEGSERILFVDDEESIVAYAKAALSSLGYDVTATLDAEEALAAFRAEPEAFDLVITDQTMPGMAGVALLAEIRATAPDVPTILTSGRPADEVGEASGFEFLQKPFGIRQLGAAVRRALEQRAREARATAS
jgi:PAS domain S-box-containing protein